MQRTIELDEYRGRQYFLAIRGEPDLESPDSFSATVYFNDAEQEERVEVARIDSAHGFVHLDKLYAEEEQKEQVEMGVWEAAERLIENHPKYARFYHEKS